MGEPKVVELKNGSREAESIVKSTMLSLRTLIGDNPIVFYELTMKCRDESHKFFGQSEVNLKELGLVQPDGRVHDSVRNVVLSACEGEGLSMELQSPIASQSKIGSEPA